MLNGEIGCHWRQDKDRQVYPLYSTLPRGLKLFDKQLQRPYSSSLGRGCHRVAVFVFQCKFGLNASPFTAVNVLNIKLLMIGSAM